MTSKSTIPFDLRITLLASVGLNGRNIQSDVNAVRSRLRQLGFVVGEDGPCGPQLIKAIQLFQAIKEGLDVIRHTRVDGRVDPNGQTLKWLNAANAPRWQRMTASGPGLHNHEATQLNDNHDFGTSWLDETLNAAGALYQQGLREGAAPISVNNASLPTGGDTPSHKGHETGLVADLRLPRKDGRSGGITTASPEYDREAMRAQLKALKAQPLFDRAYLNDQVLIIEDLCRPLGGHDNHVHFEIKPPVRQDA
jgi:hypothetical protein